MNTKNTLKKIRNLFLGYDMSEKSIHKDIMRRYLIVSFGMIIFAIVIVIKILIISLDSPKLRTSKNIKSDFEKALLKGCSYEDLKIIYDKKEQIKVKSLFNINTSSYYDFPVDVAYILEDMVFDYYKSDNIDSLYINKLKQLIKEAKEKHPFDKLEESQKVLFYTLRENAGDNYSFIENNLISISDELFSKDETIEKYLDKSNQSYLLSIVALFLTLSQFIPLLWKEWKKRTINKL